MSSLRSEGMTTDHAPEYVDGLALRCSCGDWSTLLNSTIVRDAKWAHARHVEAASLTADRDRLREESDRFEQSIGEALDFDDWEHPTDLFLHVRAQRIGLEEAEATLERQRPVIEAIRELHKPTLTTVEWWHDQTGDGHGYTCPTCRPEEPHSWDLPMGAAGVKPEGWVESYILSPCPTLAALDGAAATLEGSDG